MTEQFLSQDEVDALLEGVTGEAQKPEQPEQAEGVRAYNLGNQERIVRGRMPTMEIINERFARNFRLGLFNFMRRSPEISVGPSTRNSCAISRCRPTSTSFRWPRCADRDC